MPAGIDCCHNEQKPKSDNASCISQFIKLISNIALDAYKSLSKLLSLNRKVFLYDFLANLQRIEVSACAMVLLLIENEQTLLPRCLLMSTQI